MGFTEVLFVVLKILLAILLFSAIILFHEFGHFIVAKACDVQVNEFAIGLGPNLLKFGKGETKFCIKALPFGGACMMEGEDDESNNPRAFPNKKLWQRFLIVFAGPFFNFIMAFICAFIVICMTGYDVPVLSGVLEGYSAEEAGLQAGDTIVKMNHHHVHFYGDIRIYSFFHEGEPVTVVYERDGQRYSTELVPIYNEEADAYYYGFTWDYTYAKGNVFTNLKYAFYEVGYYIYATVGSLKMLFTGGAGFNDLSGPVGIVNTVGNDVQAAAQSIGVYGVILTILDYAILLSANLGVMNLLPLPAIDGGRIMFFIIEAIRRKKIDPKKEGFVHLIGIVLLLLLMVAVMFNDIRKLFM